MQLLFRKLKPWEEVSLVQAPSTELILRDIPPSGISLMDLAQCFKLRIVDEQTFMNRLDSVADWEADTVYTRRLFHRQALGPAVGIQSWDQAMLDRNNGDFA